MNSFKLCPLFLALACTAVAHSAERHPEPAGPVLLALAESVVAPMHMGTAAEAKPASPGIAESLPDLPRLTVVSSPFRVAAPLSRPTAAYDTFKAAMPDGPGVSLLEASPLAGAARRVGAQNFNTQDGSSVDAFAICYRLSRRSSVQVIPGDPAPVKIPVTAMANNMGVTVGMVVRLSRAR